MSSRCCLIQFSARRDGSSFSGLLAADGLRKAGYEVLVIFGSEGPIIDTYRERGHRVEVIPHKNWLRGDGVTRTLRNALAERLGGAAMARRLKGFDPACVHVNTAASYAGAVAAQHLGIPCVWHLRELFSDVGGELKCPAILRGFVRREFHRLATVQIANSQAVAESLLGAVRSVAVIPNAVEDRFFVADLGAERARARCSLGLPGDAVVIGLPGTLRPVKGHRFFLEALAPLLAEVRNLFLVSSGDTNHAFGQEITAFARSLPGAEQIRFIGEQADMVPFYTACDIICVPSSSESFGRTVIEAMAVGVPVVATKVGGIPEIITSNDLGTLVPFGDRDALRRAVEELVRDRKLANRRASAARRVAWKEYRAAVYQARIVEAATMVVRGANHRQGPRKRSDG